LGGCGGGDSGNDTPKTPEILYSFGDSSVDPTIPDRGLLKGSDGNFYGATWLDGASGKGAVFKITPTGEKSVLHSFAGGPTDGAYPSFPLIQGRDGNFYGTTGSGGANNLGTVYMLTPAGALTILYSFAGGAGDGAVPDTGLLQASDGNFYGMTLEGGTNDTGTIFKLTPSGADTVLYSFAPLGQPKVTALSASFIEGSDGNFYSVSMNGGAGNRRTVFRGQPRRRRDAPALLREQRRWYPT